MAEETAESRPYHEDPSGQDYVPEQADMDILTAALESILFAMGDSVPIAEIARALCVPEERARETADLLAERYRKKDSGLILNWLEDEVQLSTKPEMNEYLIRIASEPKKPKLTPTLMETLSIIAFRQPVTRMEVENIRGVNSDFAISRLVSFDLVQEVGRKEVPGRPLVRDDTAVPAVFRDLFPGGTSPARRLPDGGVQGGGGRGDHFTPEYITGIISQTCEYMLFIHGTHE